MKSKNTIYRVSPHLYPEAVNVPSSKSYANRLLILGALSSEKFTVSNLTPSTDVITLIEALKSIGLDVEGDAYQGEVRIHNSFPACEKECDQIIELKTGDGGTTNRFLLALLGLGRNRYRLKTSGRMKDRPAAEFFSVLKELGVKITQPEGGWCEVQGPLLWDKSEIEVDCTRSTQFATALSLVLGPKKIRVIPIGLKNSHTYFELTQELLKQFIKGKRDFEVPADASSLTYPLALGFDGTRIRIPNCHFLDPFQADTQFIKILEAAGAKIHFEESGLILERKKGVGIPVDISIASCPDLAPTLAFICALLEGTSSIRDIEILRHKESDRACEIMKVLEKLEVEHGLDTSADRIWIKGPWKRKARAIDLELPEDHRIIMMAYLFLNSASGGSLNNAAHVEKSFPNFFSAMSGVKN